MNELIRVVEKEFQGVKVKTCDGRELWTTLHSKQDFSHWIKGRIKKYGYAEGVDYLSDKFIVQVPHQGGTRAATEINYTLTLDVAKEMAMVENNDEGRAARLYFIECERRLLAQPSQALQLPDFTNPAAAARAWADSIEKAQLLKLENAQVALELKKTEPIVEAFDTLAGMDGSVCLSDAAKNLGWNPGKFIIQLELMGWVFRRNEANGLKGKVKAMQKHIDAGQLVHKMVPAGVSSATGLPRYDEQVRVTHLGKAKLALLLGSQGALVAA